jgi:DNA (cytosine-5)-methyltransferase 1
VRIGSLCSGYGGLEMAVQSVLGGETAWVSDIDKGACKILAHRFPGVPNLGDFTKTDWAEVERVDLICAGFPCQPVSHAGKRLGDEDERWLWDDVLRAVREVRPGVVVLENVRGLLTARDGELFATDATSPRERYLTLLESMNPSERMRADHNNGHQRRTPRRRRHGPANGCEPPPHPRRERHGRGQDRRGLGRVDREA